MLIGKFKIKGQWAAHLSTDAEVVKIEEDQFLLNVGEAGQLVCSIYDFEDGEYMVGGSELKKGMKAKVYIFLAANVEESFKEQKEDYDG